MRTRAAAAVLEHSLALQSFAVQVKLVTSFAAAVPQGRGITSSKIKALGSALKTNADHRRGRVKDRNLRRTKRAESAALLDGGCLSLAHAKTEPMLMSPAGMAHAAVDRGRPCFRGAAVAGAWLAVQVLVVPAKLALAARGSSSLEAFIAETDALWPEQRRGHPQRRGCDAEA